MSEKIHYADPSDIEAVKNFVQDTDKVVFCLGYEGCPPCRGLKAVINKDSTEYKLVYLDIQIHNDFRPLGLGGVPTWVAFDKGELKFSGKGFPASTGREFDTFLTLSDVGRAVKLEEFAKSILGAG